MGGDQLKVNYADGSARIVNLHSDFFTNTPAYSALLKKMVVISPTEKAKVLADLYGRQPLSVVLTQGGHVVFKKETEQTLVGHVNAEKVALAEMKKLRKEHEGKPWTIIFNSCRELKKLFPALSL